MFATFSMISNKAPMIHGFSRIYLYSFVMLFIYVILSLFIAIIMDTLVLVFIFYFSLPNFFIRIKFYYHRIYVKGSLVLSIISDFLGIAILNNFPPKSKNIIYSW